MKIEHEEIDLFQDKWDMQKIFLLGNFLVENYGESHQVQLFISPNNFDELKEEYVWDGVNYTDRGNTGFTQFVVYTSCGRISIFPTTKMDYVTFEVNGFTHSINIRNKVREYKEEFDKLVND